MKIKPVYLPKSPYWTFIFSFLLLASSGCYSVGIMSRDAIPEPDELNTEGGLFKNLKVVDVKENLNLGVVDNHIKKIENIGSRGFHTIEYRVTLGDVLLSAITFGKVRKLRIRYVPEKN